MTRGERRKSTVRIGVTTLVVTSEDRRDRVFYDKLFALCDRVLPGCGCDVVLLPERAETRPDERQPLDGPLFRRFQALARRENLWLLAPLVEAAGRRTYNTMVVVSPQGERVSTHRKVHLPPGEEKEAVPGDAFGVFDTPWFRGGVLICFDNKFPETSRCLALRGASVLFFPSYGDPVKPHRNAARCLDNNVYLVGAGVIDRSCGLPDAQFERGMVLDPSGRLLVQTGTRDGLAVAELPLDAMGRLMVPAEFDFIERRRPQCYGEITRPLRRVRK